MNKRDLRKLFFEKAFHLSAERKKQASLNACEHLYKLSQKETLVASFSPIEPEIDITAFNLKMMSEKKLALPKVSGKGLIFYPVSSAEDLEKSKWGILEPKNVSSAVNPFHISLALIPGLCFDSCHYRLGRGKGFYDYFLSLHTLSKKIGVGFFEQLSSQLLPTELHDQKLDQVLLF